MEMGSSARRGKMATDKEQIRLALAGAGVGRTPAPHRKYGAIPVPLKRLPIFA